MSDGSANGATAWLHIWWRKWVSRLCSSAEIWRTRVCLLWLLNSRLRHLLLGDTRSTFIRRCLYIFRCCIDARLSPRGYIPWVIVGAFGDQLRMGYTLAVLLVAEVLVYPASIFWQELKQQPLPQVDRAMLKYKSHTQDRGWVP